MSFWSVIKQGIPLIIGVLIGAGLTKNKYVMGIIITYIIIMVLFGLLRKKVMKVQTAKDKKQALKDAGVDAVTGYIETTAEGNQKGATLFDKYYPEYIFYLNIMLLITTIVLAVKQVWFWSLFTFAILHFHIVLNQIFRHTKNIEVQKLQLQKP